MDLPEPNGQKEESGVGLPPGLGDALRRLNKASILIPPQVDEAVLGEAMRHFGQICRRRSHLRRAGWMALAASVVLGLWVAQAHFAGNGILAVKNVKPDGRVDILAAFQLAREIRDGKQLSATNDLNGDGRVDGADVTILANRAVKLGNGGPL